MLDIIIEETFNFVDAVTRDKRLQVLIAIKVLSLIGSILATYYLTRSD